MQFQNFLHWLKPDAIRYFSWVHLSDSGTLKDRETWLWQLTFGNSRKFSFNEEAFWVYQVTGFLAIAKSQLPKSVLSNSCYPKDKPKLCFYLCKSSVTKGLKTCLSFSDEISFVLCPFLTVWKKIFSWSVHFHNEESFFLRSFSIFSYQKKRTLRPFFFRYK
jgi:hypothetical protein